MPGRDEHDARDVGTEAFASDDVEDVFAGGRVDPSVVEASVDALFERFEEDTPGELMLADRYPTEADVVPTPPAFDEFAADVDHRLPERATDDHGDDSGPAPDASAAGLWADAATELGTGSRDWWFVDSRAPVRWRWSSSRRADDELAGEFAVVGRVLRGRPGGRGQASRESAKSRCRASCSSTWSTSAMQFTEQ